MSILQDNIGKKNRRIVARGDENLQTQIGKTMTFDRYELP